MRPSPIKSVAAAGFAFSLLLIPSASRSGTNLVTTSVVGGSTGWFTTPGIWRTNNGSGVGIGVVVTNPVPGNTYTLMPNGTAIGNNQGETRLRNVYTNG